RSYSWASRRSGSCSSNTPEPGSAARRRWPAMRVPIPGQLAPRGDRDSGRTPPPARTARRRRGRCFSSREPPSGGAVAPPTFRVEPGNEGELEGAGGRAARGEIAGARGARGEIMSRGGERAAFSGLMLPGDIGRGVEHDERRHVRDVRTPDARRVQVGPGRLGVVRQAGVARGHVTQVVGQHGTGPENRGEEGREEQRGGGAGGGLAHTTQVAHLTQSARRPEDPSEIRVKAQTINGQGPAVLIESRVPVVLDLECDGSE